MKTLSKDSTQSSEFGFLVSQERDSHWVYYKGQSKSQMSLQRDSRQVFIRLTKQWSILSF